ncbi:GFA family protein [Bdellovibrio sp. NC01]|uniref:GFA family protein n=1 Tax=Bdellovibrio sp. NC01 TaxID=2220073 RepID=UPI0011577D1B|nr:GFA family protein [Bdellovibrio sp. NC01]QDK36382.1 GFA family protein [Bdellovibrio sp. NC01]
MKHTGGCHCGKVRYEVDINVANAISCNCSICMKKGTLLDFVPEENFKLLSGEQDLTHYHFNKKVIDHSFCKHCGVQAFAKGKSPDGKVMAAINLRCLDNVDLSKLKIQEINGRDF